MQHARIQHTTPTCRSLPKENPNSATKVPSCRQASHTIFFDTPNAEMLRKHADILLQGCTPTVTVMLLATVGRTSDAGRWARHVMLYPATAWRRLSAHRQGKQTCTQIAQWMHTHTCHVTDCREKSVLGHSADVRCSYMAGSRQHNTSCHSRVQSQPTPAQCSAVRQQHSVPSAVRQLPKQCQMKHQQYEHSGHSGHVHMPKNCLQSKAQKTVT